MRGVRDRVMEEYILSTYEKLQTVQNIDELAKLKQDLTIMLESVAQSYALVQEVEKLGAQAWSDKGNQIARALSEVPLLERDKIALGESLETEAVLKALASHEYFRFLSKERREGNLDPKKASSMFLDFKSRHQSEMFGEERPGVSMKSSKK